MNSSTSFSAFSAIRWAAIRQSISSGSYCSDMTRTVAVGHVTEEMEKVYYTVLEAQKAGIATAKAGATGKEVHEAAAKVIEDAGYGKYFGHGFGHGVGQIKHSAAHRPRGYFI